jgi:DNA-binding winged helix-turn-helix (wHTH) protein/tetratricopeptide (TPR) repeat protein
MEPVVENGKIYEFADFRLIPVEELLLRNGERVPLNSKSFRVLTMLVERHGHLVTKLEIIDTIWKDSFVEEGSITKAIWAVRQALEDTSKEGFIQTVPRRGYRFVFPVTIVANGSSAYSVSDLTRFDKDVQKADFGTENPRTSGFSGAISVAGESSPVDLAVRAQNDLLSSSRNRTGFTALKAYASIALVVLAGIVLYSTVNWRSFGKTNGPPDRGTNNEEAYQLYQQAENLSEGRLRKDMPVALDDLNQAVALDPNFARAWAAKALLHRYLAAYAGADQTEQYQKSMDAVGKALAIDPDNSVAQSSLCLNKFLYEYDFAGAESACKRALEVDPDSSVAHKAYANFLYSRGRSDEAIAESRRAIELQPLSREHRQTYALALYYARRYEEEEVQWKRLLELNPSHSYIYTRLFINLAQQGKEDKAFEYLIKKLRSEDKQDDETIERFRSAFAASGWRGVTTERIKHPELEGFTGPFDVACLYATIGDKEKAFEFLEKAYQEHNYRISVLEVEPQLDPLRDDPRFADLVRRVNGGVTLLQRTKSPNRSGQICFWNKTTLRSMFINFDSSSARLRSAPG